MLMAGLLALALFPAASSASGGVALLSTGAALEISSLPSTEGDIRNGGKKIAITLTGNTWASDIDDDTQTGQAKRDALFSAIKAGSEQAQWAKVISALKSAGAGAVSLDTANATLTITLPAVGGYDITANQTITINIPSNLLDTADQAAPLSFAITADISASISGTVIGATESDIASGGKTIVLTLTNAKWASDIAANRIKREALIDKFTCNDNIWDSVKAAAKATGTVTRNTDNKVTIKLAAVPGFNISSDISISFAGIANTENMVTDNNDTAADVPAISNAFSIKAVTNQTAAISGSILPKTSELDVAQGGKVITVTLSGDTWAQGIDSSLSSTLLSAFTASPSSPAWSSVISSATVTLANPSTVNIMLPAVPNFNIDSDMTVTLTIPPSLLTTSNTPVTASPSFTISAVTATLSGTAFTGAFDAAAVQKGGKTIIITLNNASWVSDAVSDSAKLNALLSAFSGNAWTPIKNALLANPKNISLKGNQITIKLPPVPNYNSSGTVTLTIPQSLIANGNSDITAAPSLSIGAIATASISTSPSQLYESNIVSGDARITITLTSATWVSDAASPAKIAALLKGFAPDSQPEQWKKIQSAASSATALLGSNNTVLTIILPAVADYDIVKDQTVAVTVPKAMTSSGSADINAGSFTIKAKTVSATMSLQDALSDGTLASWLENTPTLNIYLIVPPKHVYSVDASRKALGTSTITDVTVTTDAAVASVIITAGSNERRLDAPASTSAGKKIFNAGFTGVPDGSDLKVSVLNSEGNPIQAEMIIKLKSGKTTYSEMPKSDLSGSYSLHRLMSDDSLFKSILQYYKLSDIYVGIA